MILHSVTLTAFDLECYCLIPSPITGHDIIVFIDVIRATLTDRLKVKTTDRVPTTDLPVQARALHVFPKPDPPITT